MTLTLRYAPSSSHLPPAMCDAEPPVSMNGDASRNELVMFLSGDDGEGTCGIRLKWNWVEAGTGRAARKGDTSWEPIPPGVSPSPARGAFSCWPRWREDISGPLSSSSSAAACLTLENFCFCVSLGAEVLVGPFFFFFFMGRSSKATPFTLFGLRRRLLSKVTL